MLEVLGGRVPEAPVVGEPAREGFVLREFVLAKQNDEVDCVLASELDDLELLASIHRVVGSGSADVFVKMTS